MPSNRVRKIGTKKPALYEHISADVVDGKVRFTICDGKTVVSLDVDLEYAADFIETVGDACQEIADGEQSNA